MCALIRHYWENGFGDMLQKRIPFGKQCYILGMVLIEVTGCARWLRNLMESAFGDISVLDGYVSLLLFKFEVGDLNLFAFEMMLGVGKCLFVRHSLHISHCTTPRGLGRGSYEGSNGSLLWDITFLMPFQDWEEALHSFFALFILLRLAVVGMIS